MASPVNLWVLLGASIAGLVLAACSLRKRTPHHYGAIIKYLNLSTLTDPFLPLAGLTFGVQDIFDIEGLVTGFGCPDWEKSHGPAQSSASALLNILQSGATCIGKTHMDEMAISMNGVNKHYGTPINPAASNCVPGGSSSGSAVTVAAKLVDFSLGIDTVGDIRVPAAYCSVFGYRASHGAISHSGVVPVSQSLDAVGWFANDPKILWRVGNAILPQRNFEVKQLRKIIIAEDCFNLIANAEERNQCISIITNAFRKELGDQSVTQVKLGEYFASKLPSLKLSIVCFRIDGQDGKSERGNAALKHLKDAFQLIQRYEFKVNHEKWIGNSQGSKISKQIKEVLAAQPYHFSDAMKLRNESRAAINELLMNDSILVLPTVPGSPPRLRGRGSDQADFEEHVLTLMSIAGMSGACQVSMPIGKHNGAPNSVSLIARNGMDCFLLDALIRLFPLLEKEIEDLNKTRQNHVEPVHQRPDAAELAKEKGNAAFKKKDYRSAIRNYSEAIQYDSENATYYSNRAAAYLATRSFYQAEADCTKAIEFDKKNVKAFLRRGTTRELLGCFKEAEEDFNEALVLEPSNKAALEGNTITSLIRSYHTMKITELPNEMYKFVTRLRSGTIPTSEVESLVTEYEKFHTPFGGEEEERKSNYAKMSNIYYDLVTAFYEYGWGESFHFAHRIKGENFAHSIKRQEYYLALQLGLKPGMKVLDVGCGIGGPLRNIAAFSHGAAITGLNNNEYQIKRGIELNKKCKSAKNCDFLKADFMNIPMPDNTYDAIYTIESCCHAPELVPLYKELKRVLKPGQLLAGYDWCMTKAYDPTNRRHEHVKAEIELGNGLPTIRTIDQYLTALNEAGFEVIMECDLAQTSEIPWYKPLNPSRFSLNGFTTTSLGRFLLRKSVSMLEFSRVIPKGSLEVNLVLERAADGLLEGGRLEIFTPMFFFLIRKPFE